MTSLLAAATLPDAITFAVAAVICVVGALGVVLSRNPVHAGLMLVMTLFGIAVLFVEENAQFLGAVQVIVYTGAIVVLFLFVIMLIGVDRDEKVFAEGFNKQRPLTFLCGLAVLAEILLLAHQHWVTGAKSVTGATHGAAANTADLGRAIFTTYLLPFEVTSALLVVAIIGAVVLARRPMRAAADGNPGATGRTHPPVAGDSGTDAGADALTPAQRPADDALVGGSAYPEGER
jgi:NADH-quinone oxidoreductase subunit J